MEKITIQNKERNLKPLVNFFKKYKTQEQVMLYCGCMWEANELQNKLLNLKLIKIELINGYLHYIKV